MPGSLIISQANESNSSFPFDNNLAFPDRPSCFNISDGIISDDDCPVAPSMLDFLNITTPKSYFDAYCLDPPDDSCSFGFCPNPDIAGPAVRYSTYVTNICLALVVWYEPDDAKDSFYAQILTVYSLVISAIISITEQELTKIHALFATVAAASPLSVYLFFYALKSCFGHTTRLESVFGADRWINRLITLIIVPIWIALLVFLTLPKEAYHFQQAACEQFQHFAELLFIGPLIVLVLAAPGDPFFMACLALTILPFIGWAVGLYLQRHEVWDGSHKLPFKRIWKVVMKHYPFIEFCIALAIPHLYWLLSLEIGSTFDNEYFEADYGQLLAIFVAVPPLISVCGLLPRCGRWFWDLTWVRFLRRAEPRYERTLDSDLDPSENPKWSDRLQYKHGLPIHTKSSSTYSLDTLTDTFRQGNKLAETPDFHGSVNVVSQVKQLDSDDTKSDEMNADEPESRTPTKANQSVDMSNEPGTWHPSPSPWISLEP